jgi:hypothetical protein
MLPAGRMARAVAIIAYAFAALLIVTFVIGFIVGAASG